LKTENPLAIALVDKRDKLASIVTILSRGDKFSDYSDIDKDGKPCKVSRLKYLRYGTSGVTFEDIALLLEDTRSLDKGK